MSHLDLRALCVWKALAVLRGTLLPLDVYFQGSPCSGTGSPPNKRAPPFPRGAVSFPLNLEITTAYSDFLLSFSSFLFLGTFSKLFGKSLS